MVLACRNRQSALWATVYSTDNSDLELKMTNLKFREAMGPHLDRIAAYFGDRFPLWEKVMSTLTDGDLNPQRMQTIAEHAEQGKKICVVIPERAHPRLYLAWLLDFAKTVLDAGGKLENTHVIFAGGVVGQIGTDGQLHSFADMYGELNASAMDHYLRHEGHMFKSGTKYNELFPPERVTCENISKNTGDQACIVANMIVGSSAELVVFLGPNEHVARFALTIHCGIRTYSAVFRGVYLKRLEKMRILVVPVFRDGGWQAMTDLDGVTSAEDAFGPLDTDAKRLELFPKKQRGQELAERIGGEMYEANALTFIMNVTTLEDAVADPLFQYELGNLEVSPDAKSTEPQANYA